MDKKKVLIDGGVLLFVFILSTSIALATGRADMSRKEWRESGSFTIRERVVQTALASDNVFDCTNYRPDRKALLPVETRFFGIIQDVKITPDDGRDYLGAVWSPDGSALVFVAPTGEQRPVEDRDALPSDEETQLVAVSKNELWLYFPERDAWERITPDGARPVWSTDGKVLYYMAGYDLMVFDMRTKSSDYTGLSAPRTGNGLLFSQPLSDGRLLAPQHPSAPLEVIGNRIEVSERDYILLSPSADKTVVAYGANTWQGKFTPAVTVLYHPTKGTVPLLKNCQYSALEMTWSPTGDRIAYPVHADRPEIRIYDVESGQTSVLIRLDTFEPLSGLSWSPDGLFLTFTQGDGRSGPRSIWVVAADGTKRQLLLEGGMLPQWSPDGRHLLYARPASNRLLDWYLLKMNRLPLEVHQ